MDFDTIKNLIRAMDDTNLAEMEFSQEGWTLRLVRRRDNTQQPPRSLPDPVPYKPHTAGIANKAGTKKPAPREAARETVIESPMFGIVYLRPNPEASDFVTAGHAISAGTTVCLIESMKMFNEVKTTSDTTIASILVKTGDEVEAGQPLMMLASDHV